MAKTYTLNSGASRETVTVHGTVGSQYQVHLVKMRAVSGTDSALIATTKGYYNFSGGVNGFRDNITTVNVFTIGSEGKSTHTFSLPSTTDDTRYEFHVTPSGDTVTRSGTPSTRGDLTIIKNGVSRITIQAEASTETNWQLTGSAKESGVTPVRTKTFSRRKTGTIQHYSTAAYAQAALTSGKRLSLKKADSRIRSGMYVISPFNTGVPHLTTVVNVNGNVITLSANSTVAVNDMILIESNTRKIFPFELTIPAGYGPVGSELVVGGSGTNENSTFNTGVGDWLAYDPSVGSSVSVAHSSGKLQVTTTTDNAIEGARLPIEDVGNGSHTTTAINRVYRVSMDLDLTTPGSGTMEMRMSLGGAISDAFNITTTETTYTADLMPTNVGGADINDLLIYNTSSTATVFTVDNVSVKNLPYRNLTVLTSADAAYKPQEALGGNRSNVEITAASTTSGDTVYVSDYNPNILTGMVLEGDNIWVDGKNYVEITAGNLSGKSITVASVINVTEGDIMTAKENPDTTTNLATSGIDLLHIHASTTSGNANDQEVASIYGYLKTDNVSNSATMPIYLDNILTSAAF